MKKNFLLLLSMLTMFALTFTACSSDDDDEPQKFTVNYNVDIKGVTYGKSLQGVAADVKADYVLTFSGKTFTSKEEAFKAADAIYNGHKTKYANVITSGEVRVKVDNGETKTYDYSFAKYIESTIDAKALLTTWRLVSLSQDNGASWKDATEDVRMNGCLFNSDGTGKLYTTPDEEDESVEPSTDNITYTLNGNQLTINYYSTTLKHDVVELSSTDMILHLQGTTECFKYTAEVTVRTIFQMNDALAKLLKTKKLNYYNHLNAIAEHDMADGNTFNLSEAHLFFPVKAGSDLSYTIDESAYTEGETVKLSYSYTIALVQGADKEVGSKHTTDSGSQECSSLEEIKTFVEGMRKDLNAHCYYMTSDSKVDYKNFSELK